MEYTRPNRFLYRLTQVAAWFVAVFLFGRRIVRNELKGVKGPFVVIANHQAAYDFVNLIGLCRRPMTFVISSSFYQTLPVKGILRHIGVIPKQQFRTSVGDMKRMKAVLERGEPLVIYPAGLMCEDGLSTPIPEATYKFLKWLDADVYMARTAGTYFAMPKWSKKLRPGRTELDVYRLFTRQELAALEVEEVRARAREALLFDAYREQERLRVRYRGGSSVEGLENVLYLCPHCRQEFSVKAEGRRLTCSACGYELESDEYGFLHNRKGLGEELRYVSDWSTLIARHLEERVREGSEGSLSAHCRIRMIDGEKNRFVDVGGGEMTLSRAGFRIVGDIGGSPADLTVPLAGVPSLPFGPGSYLEIQHGKTIYRCLPDDGRVVIKFIHLVKIFHRLRMEAETVKL